MEALYEVIHKKQEGDYLAKYFCLFFASILFKKVSSKMSLYGIRGFIEHMMAGRKKFFQNFNVPAALKLPCSFLRGGRGGIRTHETICMVTVFETVALNHLATLPKCLRRESNSQPNGSKPFALSS
jgi:hypothetical protein